MDRLFSSSHHAKLFVHPDRKNIVEAIWKELQPQSIAHTMREQTVIDIDSARAIITWANTPYEGGKTMLLSFHTITIPAQNALLKILEEPQPGIRFILVTSSKDSLIKTLLSRLQDLSSMEVTEKINTKYVREFLETSYSERMKLPSIVELLAKTDEEGRKDREETKAFIVSLAKGLSSKETTAKEYSKEILTTLEMASHTTLPSSSLKSILEYLALLLPEVRV